MILARHLTFLRDFYGSRLRQRISRLLLPIYFIIRKRENIILDRIVKRLYPFETNSRLNPYLRRKKEEKKKKIILLIIVTLPSLFLESRSFESVSFERRAGRRRQCPRRRGDFSSVLRHEKIQVTRCRDTRKTYYFINSREIKVLRNVALLLDVSIVRGRKKRRKKRRKEKKRREKRTEEGVK